MTFFKNAFYPLMSRTLLVSFLYGSYMNLSMAMDPQKVTDNPNDIILMIDEIHRLDLVSKTHTGQIDKVNDRVSESVKRISTLEKFMNNYKGEIPRFDQTIPNDMVLKLTLSTSFIFALFKLTSNISLSYYNFIPIFIEHYCTSIVTFYFLYKLVQTASSSMPFNNHQKNK